MTLNDVQRAALALYAARTAGQGAALEQMKAIAYCIRNRVKAGWYDGQWLTVMEHAEEVAGNAPEAKFYLDPNNRALQRLISDIDDIYYGGRSQGAGAGDLEGALGASCYWCRIDQPITAWFREHIIERPEEHPSRPVMGLTLFFD